MSTKPMFSILVLATAISCAGATESHEKTNALVHSSEQVDRSDPETLFRLAEELAAKGEYEKALSEYGAVLQLYKKARNLSGAGRTVNRIGRLHLDTGNFKTARKAFAASKVLLEKAGDDLGKAELYKNLGVLEDLSGHPDLAGEYLEKAYNLYSKLNDRLGTAHCLMNKGVLEESFGRHEKAEKLTLDALELYKSQGSLRFQAAALNNLAKIGLATGNYLKALDLLKKALSITRRLGLSPFEAQVLANLGAVYQRLGQIEESESAFKQALRINERDGRNREVARNRVSLARLYRARNDLNAAEEQYAMAAEFLEKVGDKASLLEVQEGRAALLLQRGDRHSAMEAIDLALSTAKNLGRQADETKLLAMAAMADMQADLFLPALERLKRALKLAESLGTPEEKVLVLELLSYCYRKLGKLKQAISMSEASVSESERLRGAVSDDRFKTGLFSRFVGGYSRLSDLYLELYGKTQDRTYLYKAFKAMEMGRARGLLDMMSHGGVEVRKGVPDELKRYEQELDRKLKDATAALRQAKGPDERKVFSKKLNDLLAEQERFISKLRREHPNYAALKYPVPAGLQDVQKDLGRDEVLLEYTATPSNARIWAIERQGVEVLRYDYEKVKKWIVTYRYVLKDPLVRGLARARRKLLERKLYDELIAPVRHRMESKKRILVSPSAELYNLPFSALRDERGDFLGDTMVFTYVPSASVLLRLDRAPGTKWKRLTYLAFADPVFAPDDDPSRLPEGSLKLKRLPGTAAEVEAAAKSFGSSATVFLRERAKESVLKAMKLDGYSVLHFATHGLLGPEISWLGQPALAMSCCDDSQDGLLTMEEVFNLKLSAELVLLSACNTGRGKEVRGEGVMALTRAFFYAGTQSIMVTLWPVSDESTSLLISYMAKGLANGKAPSTALFDAKKHLRSQVRTDRWGRPFKPYEHPFYWAPFVVLGRR